MWIIVNFINSLEVIAFLLILIINYIRMRFTEGNVPTGFWFTIREVFHFH